jgi:hypothetical protein
MACRSGGAFDPVPADVSADTRVYLAGELGRLPNAADARGKWSWDGFRSEVAKVYRQHPQAATAAAAAATADQFAALLGEDPQKLSADSRRSLETIRRLLRDWYPVPSSSPPPLLRSSMAAPPPLTCVQRSGENALMVTNRFKGAAQLFFRVYRVSESAYCRPGAQCVQSIIGPHSAPYKIPSLGAACIYYRPLSVAGASPLRIYWGANPAHLGSEGPPPDRLDINSLRIVPGRDAIAIGP